MLAVFGCDSQKKDPANPTANNPGSQQTGVPVEVLEVQAETFTESARAVGTLRARAAVEIRPEMTGILKKIHFREGEEVAEGSLLFSIDDRKLTRELKERQEALKAAKARVEKARRDFDRTKRLIDTQAISQAEWDSAQTALMIAQAEEGQVEAAIELIEERLDDTNIKAPFGGITAECRVDPGDYLQAGDHLVTLYTLSPIEMSAKIPERYMGAVRPGQQAAVLVDAYPDRKFSGAVTFVSPDVDDRTRNFLIKITIDNEERLLKPGAFGTALLTLRTLEDRPAVPEESLVATTEGYIVYVVEDGIARKRGVQVGLRKTGLSEIREGLEVGEMVVRTGHIRLSEGDKVSWGKREPSKNQSTKGDTKDLVYEGSATSGRKELHQ